MVKPRLVQRSGQDAFYGSAWNAMIDICAMEPLSELTANQRTAALAFWYMSEVNNGGHFQYFVNKASFPHAEVAAALDAIGATHSANVLRSVLGNLGLRRPEYPKSAEDYLESEKQFDLSAFDAAWGSQGDTEINRCLENYLRAHECEFVVWAD